MALWDDAVAPFTGQGASPDPSSMWGWLTSFFQNGQPFKSGNPALDQMMMARAQPEPQQRAEPPPLGQSLMDLSSMVAPYLVGGAPAGTLSAGMKLPGRISEAASDLPAPAISKGAEAPLFDYSLKPPDVPQTPLVRAAEPPKGIPSYVEAIRDPQNIERVKSLTQEGLERLGDRYWYNPSPVTDAFGNVLGSADEATRNLKIYADMMGNTTNLARVPQNMRMASYYYQKFLEDPLNMPTDVPPKGSGYGHAAQQQHLTNVQNWWENQAINPMMNPKPASFSENIMGNYQPYTWDTRNAQIWNLRNPSGQYITASDKAHYGYLEATGQDVAKQMNIPPARQQEASWITMEPPGPVQTFAEGLEQKIRDTAAKFNMDPREVLKLFAQGKQLLWSSLPAGLLGSQLIPSDEGTR